MNIITKDLEEIQTIIKDSFFDSTENQALKHFVLNGSKMVRSRLAVLYIKSHGYDINEKTSKILAAGEIIHNASLLHDDVLDEQTQRRGETTLAQKFSPKVSILAGDYLLSIAVEQLLSVNNAQILEIFKNCTKNMAEAEIKQYFLRGKIPSEQEYLKICKEKTSSLFAAILKSCAVITGLKLENAETFAIKFGICFQIKNDLESFSAQTDKKNKIYTAKDILGIEKTSALLDNYKEEMRDLLQDIPNNIYKQELEDLINLL